MKAPGGQATRWRSWLERQAGNPKAPVRFPGLQCEK